MQCAGIELLDTELRYNSPRICSVEAARWTTGHVAAPRGAEGGGQGRGEAREVCACAVRVCAHLSVDGALPRGRRTGMF